MFMHMGVGARPGALQRCVLVLAGAALAVLGCNADVEEIGSSEQALVRRGVTRAPRGPVEIPEVPSAHRLDPAPARSGSAPAPAPTPRVPSAEDGLADLASLTPSLVVVATPASDRLLPVDGRADGFVSALSTELRATEVLHGSPVTSVSLVQEAYRGRPLSDGFLRPVLGRRYVLLLVPSRSDPSSWVLARSVRSGRPSWLREQGTTGTFISDLRPAALPLDRVRRVFR